MPSLIDIRRRIRSVKNTQQITKAMKMVSAAKLRRAQDRVIAVAALRRLLRQGAGERGRGRAIGRERGASIRCWRSAPEQRILLVLVTGDKGLAGAFNANLIKGAQRFLCRARRAASVRIELVGRKGRDFFRKRGATDHRRARRTWSTSAVSTTRRAIAARPSSGYAQRRDRRGLPALQRVQERGGAEAHADARAAGARCREQARRSDYIFEQPPGGDAGAPAAALRRDGVLPRACSNPPRPNTPRA